MDLSYLKKVKSKVDCWTTRMSSIGPKQSENKEETENAQSEESPHRFNMSPKKSPKELDCVRESKDSLSPPKKNKSEELIKSIQEEHLQFQESPLKAPTPIKTPSLPSSHINAN